MNRLKLNIDEQNQKDISLAYNLERLFLLANGYDRAKTKELMNNFDMTEKVQLTEGAVEQLRKIVAGSKNDLTNHRSP